MPKAFALMLLNDGNVEMGVMGLCIVLNLVAQISYNQHKILDASVSQLINDDAEDGLAGKRNQSLGLCIGMGPKFCSGPGNWYDRFHLICFGFNAGLR
jgi:hypothetical protein